jgi:hypothetical protein
MPEPAAEQSIRPLNNDNQPGATSSAPPPGTGLRRRRRRRRKRRRRDPRQPFYTKPGPLSTFFAVVSDDLRGFLS